MDKDCFIYLIPLNHVLFLRTYKLLPGCDNLRCPEGMPK